VALQTAADAKTASDLVAKHTMTYSEESANQLDAAITAAIAEGKYSATVYLRRVEENNVTNILHSDSSKIPLEEFVAAVEERGYRMSYSLSNGEKIAFSVGWS